MLVQDKTFQTKLAELKQERTTYYSQECWLQLEYPDCQLGTIAYFSMEYGLGEALPLYGGGQEKRLLQEIVLGIGGWRLLEALEIKPENCHLNEGHAAFVALERIRAFQKEHLVMFDEALWATRAGNVFTTYTPVSAGFDRFSPELIDQYLSEIVHTLGIPFNQFLALGQNFADHPDEPFNMTYFALRTCAAANGVSRLHG